jgi:protein gp37
METVNWPVVSGCTNIGGGCESCPSLWEYEEKGWDYSLQMHPGALVRPKVNPEPTVYTVGLGSDLFHEGVSDLFIQSVFSVMNESRHHFFEVATKRILRAWGMCLGLEWGPNIALGVTVEKSEFKWRVRPLQDIPAASRFISFLPLLGSVGKINLEGIQAATVGAEEWGLKRPCQEAWIKGINKQCIDQGVELLNQARFYEGVEKCQE